MGGMLDWITGSNPTAIAASAGQAVVGSIFDGVSNLIKDFKLPPEQEVAFKLKLQELQFQTYQTQLQDLSSARQMQMSTHSAIPGVLTIILTTGFFGMLTMVVQHGLPTTGEAGSEAILLLLGALTTGFSMMLQFWFGSSMGSANKDQLLWKSTPANGGK